jgi:hypothetical protein
MQITINQYEDFNLPQTIEQPATTVGGTPTPINLTGFSASGAVFKGFTADLFHSFTFTFNSDRATGKFTASLSDTQTGSIPWGDYLFLICIKNSLGEIERLIEGTAIVKPGIQHPGL